MVNTINEDKLVKKLLEEDAAFRKDYKTHKDCELKLAKLEKKLHRTPADAVEVAKLKKLKLALKDGMTRKIDGLSN
ncbi:MAG: hypothetical protein A3J24_04755 [Deltaproteobacteria bacterium RIFCSPLOWO2_02_FULL_53_8]|nr:MAG: hypothetical protein A3J24_04755 [Deltaproteobacteria bacterium RIFCSPLOWO2_02_FULL_53_8]